MKNTAIVLLLILAVLGVLILVNKVRVSDYSRYDSIILPLADSYDVPVSWIKAFIGTESSFVEDPPVRPGDKSYGLMQVTPKTARALGFTGTDEELRRPENSILYGIKLIAELRGRFGNNFAAVYSAYNSGSAGAYKTNPQVAANVRRAEGWLGTFSA